MDELVLTTVNSKQSPQPYTVRWQITDSVRISGLLVVLSTRFASPPFVTVS